SRYHMDTPHDLPVSFLIRRLNSAKALSVHLIFELWIVNPRKPHSCIGATLLFTEFTVSFSFASRNFVTSSSTAFPCAFDLVRMTKSSAYRAKRYPLRSSSLSRLSRRMLDNNGDKGPPCGVPTGEGDLSPVRSRTPARKYRPISR